MSHFVTYVLVPAKTLSLEKAVSKLLAPYDENKAVKPYNRRCSCVGRKARDDARAAADAAVGTLDSLRETFAKMPEARSQDPDAAWRKHIAPYVEVEDRTRKAHPDRNKPASRCESCKGRGRVSTTYNPKSKWDWWTIAGRWTGMFSGPDFDASKDPDNMETCDCCVGTGMRSDEVGREARANDPNYKCNGCGGAGKRLKWTLKPVSYLASAAWVLEHIARSDDLVPFALVDPSGKWHERARMHWFAVTSGDKDPEKWKAQVERILKQYIKYNVAVVDCHI